MSPKPLRTTNGPFPVLTVVATAFVFGSITEIVLSLKFGIQIVPVPAAAPCRRLRADLHRGDDRLRARVDARHGVVPPFAVHTASAETMMPLGLSCPTCTAVDVFVAGSIR